MYNFDLLITRHLKSSISSLRLPEYAKLDLSANRKIGIKVHSMLEDPPYQEPFSGFLEPLIAFQTLEQHLINTFPSLVTVSSFDRYKALPKTNRTERIIAEIYRLLRIYCYSIIHKDGRLTCESNRVCINLIADQVVYSCKIFKPGLELLTSATVFYLSSLNSRFPSSYIEAMLFSYYTDIIDQIRDYHDEGDELLVFQPKLILNRHYRYATGNVSYTFENGFVCFYLDDYHKDGRKFPIDLYIEVDQKLHIVPLEALENDKLPVSELSNWKAKKFL